jgi:hypothetical protein
LLGGNVIAGKATGLFSSEPSDHGDSGYRGLAAGHSEVGLGSFYERLFYEFCELTMGDPALERDPNYGPKESDNRFFER